MKNDITARAEINIKAPVSKVWDALTNPATIKQYFFGTDTHTDWKVGNPIRFTGEWEGKTYEDKGTVLAFEENKKVQYSYWSSMSGLEDKPENYMIITYELSGEDDNTDLVLTQENVKDEKTKEHSEQNWNHVLGEMKKLVEGNR